MEPWRLWQPLETDRTPAEVPGVEDGSAWAALCSV